MHGFKLIMTVKQLLPVMLRTVQTLCGGGALLRSMLEHKMKDAYSIKSCTCATKPTPGHKAHAKLAILKLRYQMTSSPRCEYECQKREVWERLLGCTGAGNRESKRAV